MTEQNTPSLPSGADVAEIAARHERDVLQQRLEKDGWFSWSVIQQMLKDRATLLAALTASEVARESERDARHKLEDVLRSKDAAMQVLFDRLTAGGVDYSDLIP